MTQPGDYGYGVLAPTSGSGNWWDTPTSTNTQTIEGDGPNGWGRYVLNPDGTLGTFIVSTTRPSSGGSAPAQVNVSTGGAHYTTMYGPDGYGTYETSTGVPILVGAKAPTTASNDANGDGFDDKTGLPTMNGQTAAYIGGKLYFNGTRINPDGSPMSAQQIASADGTSGKTATVGGSLYEQQPDGTWKLAIQGPAPSSGSSSAPRVSSGGSSGASAAQSASISAAASMANNAADIASREREGALNRQQQLDLTNAQAHADMLKTRASFELQRYNAVQQDTQLKMALIDKFIAAVSSTDPMAYQAFLAAGGGNLSNALAAGGNALSDRLIAGAAALLGQINSHTGPPTWDEATAGMGAMPGAATGGLTTGAGAAAGTPGAAAIPAPSPAMAAAGSAPAPVSADPVGNGAGASIMPASQAAFNNDGSLRNISVAPSSPTGGILYSEPGNMDPYGAGQPANMTPAGLGAVPTAPTGGLPYAGDQINTVAQPALTPTAGNVFGPTTPTTYNAAYGPTGSVSYSFNAQGQLVPNPPVATAARGIRIGGLGQPQPPMMPPEMPPPQMQQGPMPPQTMPPQQPTIVGDQGNGQPTGHEELAMLPPGAQVIPHQQTIAMMRRFGGLKHATQTGVVGHADDGVNFDPEAWANNFSDPAVYTPTAATAPVTSTVPTGLPTSYADAIAQGANPAKYGYTAPSAPAPAPLPTTVTPQQAAAGYTVPPAVAAAGVAPPVMGGLPTATSAAPATATALPNDLMSALTASGATASPMQPGETYDQYVMRLRTTLQYPQMNPYDVGYFGESPMKRNSFELGLQAAKGIPQSETQFAAQQYRLGGLPQSAVNVSY